MINVQRGALRLWIVVTALWVGFIGYVFWGAFAQSISHGCWSQAIISRLYGLPDPASAGTVNYPDLWYCAENLPPRDRLILDALAFAASVPGGLLAMWFIGEWIRAGFSPEGRR
jgi:hypothetical protein